MIQLAKKIIMNIICTFKPNAISISELIYAFEEKTNEKIYLDTPEPWGVFFQDNATPQMEGLEELHNNIMFYLAIILFAVT